MEAHHAPQEWVYDIVRSITARHDTPVAAYAELVRTIKPTAVARAKNAEILTPLTLAQEMINKVPHGGDTVHFDSIIAIYNDCFLCKRHSNLDLAVHSHDPIYSAEVDYAIALVAQLNIEFFKDINGEARGELAEVLWSFTIHYHVVYSEVS